MDGAIRSGKRAAREVLDRAVRRAALIALALLASLLAAAPTAGAQRARFDTRVLAKRPAARLPRDGVRASRTGACTWAPT